MVSSLLSVPPVDSQLALVGPGVGGGLFLFTLLLSPVVDLVLDFINQPRILS